MNSLYKYGYQKNLIRRCDKTDCEGYEEEKKGCSFGVCLKRKIDKCESLINKTDIYMNYFICSRKATYKTADGKYVCKIHANEFDNSMKKMNRKERCVKLK